MRSVLVLFLLSCQPANDVIMSHRYDTADAWPRNQWDGPPGSEGNSVYKGDISLELSSGYLTSGGDFNESDPVLYLDPGGDYKFMQISARAADYEAYDLDLVRVKFTSNRIEWVWGEPSETYVFLSQEECQSYGFYCDPVIAAEGKSGFFDPGSGVLTAAINAHCTHVGLPYTYTVEAYAYDFSSYEEIKISETYYLDVSCRSE